MRTHTIDMGLTCAAQHHCNQGLSVFSAFQRRTTHYTCTCITGIQVLYSESVKKRSLL